MQRLLVPALALALLAPTPALARESSPSPTKPTCASVFFSTDKSVIDSGDTVTVTAHRRTNTPEQRITATLKRMVPEPQAIVRSDSSTATIVQWPLRLGESHRLYADSTTSMEDCHPLGAPSGFFFDVDVRPVVTIAATRNAPRDYSFTGRVLPAKGQFLTLYRHDAGRRIITAQTHLRPDGSYRFDRRFTGSGRFGFSVLAAATPSNVAGSSNVRPTVIH